MSTQIKRHPLVTYFALAFPLVGFVSTSGWGLGGNIFRNSLRKNYRWFYFIMAGLLVYTAVASLI